MIGGHENYELTVSNTSFGSVADISFHNIMTTVLLVSESLTDTLEFSFNGRDVHGKLSWDDESLTLGGAEIGRIWFKTNNPLGTPIRIFGQA